MKDVWDRIHAWLKAHAPDVLGSLRPGASEAQLAEVEEAIGAALPEEARAAYRVHDGQATGQFGMAPGFIGGWEWLSLARVRSSWKCHKDLLDEGRFDGVNSQPKGPIRKDWWHPRWVPVAQDGGGGARCLDLAPARGGRVGQVIQWWHDSGATRVLASGFAAWLAGFADELEAGEWTTSLEYHGLVHVDDV